MDYFGRGSYGQYPTYPQMQQAPYMGNYQVQQPAPMKTNKIFVTSLEDALSRYAEPNSVMVYRHQDEKMEFEVITDAQGKKNYKTLVLSDYSAVQGDNAPQTGILSQENYNALERRIEALESKLSSISKNEIAGGNE